MHSSALAACRRLGWRHTGPPLPMCGGNTGALLPWSTQTSAASLVRPPLFSGCKPRRKRCRGQQQRQRAASGAGSEHGRGTDRLRQAATAAAAATAAVTMTGCHTEEASLGGRSGTSLALAQPAGRQAAPQGVACSRAPECHLQLRRRLQPRTELSLRRGKTRSSCKGCPWMLCGQRCGSGRRRCWRRPATPPAGACPCRSCRRGCAARARPWRIAWRQKRRQKPRWAAAAFCPDPSLEWGCNVTKARNVCMTIGS